MSPTIAGTRPIPLSAWLRPVAPVPESRVVPGHNRWHPEIPAVAEVISGGSVRLECEAPDPAAGVSRSERYAAGDTVLCGPVAVLGAEPGDVIAVDVLAVGRADGRYAPAGHPGIIGCAPARESLSGAGGEPEGALLGRLRPGVAGYPTVAEAAVRTADRGGAVSGCRAAVLTAGSRVLLPVHTLGGKLSIGALHYPAETGAECSGDTISGWIDVRINLTKRGVERFGISAPVPIFGPGHAA